MIKIRVCVCFFAALLIFCASATARGQKPGDESKRDASAVAPESKSDREYYEAGRSLEEQERYEDAVREFQKISAQLRKTLYYNDLAFCLEELRRYDEAIDVLKQVLSLNPKDTYAQRELGICYYDKQQFEKAIDALQRAVSLDPSDAVSLRWLGYAFYRSQKDTAAIDALDAALKLEPNDFSANYWRGLSSLRTGRLEEASRCLGKAVEIQPADFNANLWRGISLLRLRKFFEAIPSLEKASEMRPQDKRARIELFTCYLAAGQFQKGFRLFPFIAAVAGGALTLVYLIGLVLLLPFSLPVQHATFPSLRFSIAWLLVFFVGQTGFWPLLSLVSPLGLNESVFTGLMLAGLPIIAVAGTGFARQPWGTPFQLPLRFGTSKIVAIAFGLLVLLFLMSAAFSQIYVAFTHKPPPVQHSVPLIEKALQTNPVIAWLAVPLVIPVVEEILFRGLFYGAFEKRWGIRGAVFGSAFVFACVHLQLVGFVYLFCIGVILAWARWRSGSLGLPIVIHSLNNAIVLLALTFWPAR